jgi:hypothetical protein
MNNNSTLADHRYLSKLVAETVATLAPARLTVTNTETDETTVTDFQKGTETVEQLYAGLKSGRLEKSNTPSEVFLYSDGHADIYRPPGQPATKSQQVARSLLQLAPYLSEVNVRTHGKRGFDTIRRNGQPATADNAGTDNGKRPRGSTGLPIPTEFYLNGNAMIREGLARIQAPDIAFRIVHILFSYKKTPNDMMQVAVPVIQKALVSPSGTKVSDKTVRTYLDNLVEARVIRVAQEKVQRIATVYDFRPVDEWRPIARWGRKR